MNLQMVCCGIIPDLEGQRSYSEMAGMSYQTVIQLSWSCTLFIQGTDS